MQVSGPDAAMLLLAGVVVWASWNIHREFAFAVAFVVGHFFLFCNVFRIGRKYELVWAVSFVANMLAATSFAWSWTTGMLAQLAVTAWFLSLDGGRGNIVEDRRLKIEEEKNRQGTRNRRNLFLPVMSNR